MPIKKTNDYSLANRAGITVVLLFLFIILLFGLERYQLEKARIIHHESQEIASEMANTISSPSDLSITLQKIETNSESAYREKLNALQEAVQPIIDRIHSREKSKIFAFYSYPLKTFVAVAPQKKYHSLIGNNFILSRDKKSAAEQLTQMIDGYHLCNQPVIGPDGHLQGNFWAFMPPKNFQAQLISRLQKPIIIAFIAIFLSLGFAFYLSQQIKKTTVLFQENLKSFTANPGSQLVEEKSLPREFFPLLQDYSRMVNRIQNLLEELSISARTAILGNLIGVIAHDVRNPLSIIRNSAKMALQAEKNGKKNKNLERIIKSSDEINQLLEKSLSLVRDPGGNSEMICLEKLIEEIKEVATLLLVKKNIHFLYKIPPELPKIKGNPLALRQALMNIIQNSIDATDSEGKIIISAKTIEARGILLSITDNGKGMPPEIKDKIFERFFTTKGEKGTGLGLALAQRVIKNHGGKIWAVSHPEKGTTIKIFLPTDL